VKSKVIVIPHWIAESLKRAQMQPKECIDYRKVKQVVSTDDLLTLIAAQQLTQTLIGSQWNPTSEWDLCELWQQSMNGGTESEKSEANALFELSRAGYLEEVKARLFTAGTNGDTYRPDYDKPFIIYDLMPDVIGIVVHPGFFSENPAKELKLSLVEAVIKVLYVYNTAYHELAATLWYKRFLELLAPNGR
jgi:hypothetical protein